MPVTTTVGALAVAAALAAGAAPGAGAVVPVASTCTVTAGGSTTSGSGRQLTTQEAQQLLEQTRELVASLSYAGSDTRAVALSAGIRSLGITPAVSTGWRQAVHDLADTTVVAMEADAAAGSVAVALARAGFSPTPADLRRTDERQEPGAGFTASAAVVPPLALSLDGMFAAAIASLPAEGITACGIDAGTSGGADWSAQADRLLERLESDPDPDAQHLADLITKARNGSNTVTDTETRTGNRGTDSGRDADSGRGADTGTVPETDTDQTGTDRETDNEPRTGTDRETGTGAGAQGWEAKARALAEQLEAAGDDPIARRLSDQLAAQGITARGGTGATDRTRDTADTDTTRDDDRERDDQERNESSGSDDTTDDQPADYQPVDDQPVDEEEPRDGAPAEPDDARTGSTGSTGSSGSSDWDRLAQCESSGNWAIDTGNGYKGGLQFDAAYLEVLTALRHVSCWRPWVPAR